MTRVRSLVVILGDQLDHNSAAFDGFDAAQDLVWMAEVSGEATHVLSNKLRIAFFLSAMRHFAAQVRQKYKLEYRKLDDPGNRGDLAAELRAALEKFKPLRLVMVEAGEQRIEVMLKSVATAAGVPLELRTDRHFYCSRQEFAAWAAPRKQLRMEYFYRTMRKKTDVLMERSGPAAGEWNFDKENRQSFGKAGPGLLLSPPVTFSPDAITREVLRLVNERFGKHPGRWSILIFR